MCGRATLTKANLEEIAHELEARLSPEDAARYKPRYNLAPTDLSWVLRLDEEGRRWIAPAVWGLPSDKGRPAINVRAEAVKRGAFKSRGHVLAIVDGFYEWRKGKVRRPVWYRSASGRLLLLASIEAPLGASARAPRAFSIITSKASADVAPVHDRMPVIVTGAQADEWLRGGGSDLLAPAPDGALDARDVSTRVNSVKNDDPSLLEPAENAPLSREHAQR
jgi:putative SOS response-associated peptidase YedK